MKLVFPPATIAAATLATLLLPGWAQAQAGNYPITPQQRAAAQAVAEQGVAMSELAPDAPDEYTVRRGDTLWGISAKFLRNPWRWPALWGMNLEQIRNPHLIYPGQRLWLEKVDGRARLRMGQARDGALETVRVTPRNRIEALDASPLPTLAPHLIEPFLAQPLVLDDEALNSAPRVVATQEHRVLVNSGDRAYARGPKDDPLLLNAETPASYRVFREATPLKDPETGDILGYEGHYVGQVKLVRGESNENVPDPVDPPITQVPDAGKEQYWPQPQPASRVSSWFNKRSDDLPVPATIDVLSTVQEIRPGDRLVPEPDADMRTYNPRAPIQLVDGRVISVYGEAVSMVGQNQIASINRGARDGMEPGQVVALFSTGRTVRDLTREGDRERIKLPDERNGLAMVFKVYEKVSYILVLQINDGVKAGDRIVNP
ncbi:hypothetical protein CCO03_18565 [Comamonas serinivorans]|uniref:LysM domain-containing protein n=1 Tax=Comamonas serinivorans TaxID=1082851 RepID=A0A1Y0ES18_9BURK|nr:LysM domain-containing protein [Comamonas serinivorans]ARU06393.1 hypothetical protein CCO03_18565 [Comamonas serinivorans]